MSAVQRFEDLAVWQEARKLVQCMYAYTGRGALQKDWGLVDQLRRAAVSVMSNIAEGFECQSNVEFAKFLFIAKRSAGEVRSQLYVAQDQHYLSVEEHAMATELCIKLSRQLSAFITYLRSHH